MTVARIWRGWAPHATADDYQQHYEHEVATDLGAVDGFLGARLLRAPDADEVCFTSITFFADRASIRGFAGDDDERAVVAEAAQRALTRWDQRVVHQDVVVEVR